MTTTELTRQEVGTPVSVKIRERLTAARRRFHANDNIAEFIQPGASCVTDYGWRACQIQACIQKLFN